MNVLKRTVTWKNISGVELFLLGVLFVFGSSMILMTPLGGGYDEEQHMFRVWQLAAREMLPQEMSARRANFPEIYYDLSYRRQPLVESVGFDYWEKYGGLKLDDRGYHYGPLDTRSRYTPPLLMPQAAALYIARWRNLPALWVYYLTRFAGLFTYSILAWLAVRYIPFGKWTMLVLAIAPMSIYQASTINADSITNGIGLLFIGGTLYVASIKKINARHLGALLVLFLLLFLTKPNIFPLALLPFLLITPSRFPNRSTYFLLIVCAVILFAIEFVGWNILSPNRGFLVSGNVNAAEQLRYIVTNPLAFPRVLLYDLSIRGDTYLRQWIGVYGYDYGSVPMLTYVFFALALVSSILIRTEDHQPDRRTRLILIGIFVLCYFFTALALYITYTAVAEKFVYGVQGRYLIPIFPLLFLALYNLPSLRRFKAGTWVTGLLSLAAAGVFLTGLILVYHVACGTSYYQFGQCYQPFYKNFAPLLHSSPPISNHTVLEQEIIPVCNGMASVQVRVNSPGDDPEGMVEFTVHDNKENTDLAQTKVKNSSLPADWWYAIDFAPDWFSAGKTYTLTLRGISGQMGKGPLLAYSLKPEYPLGILYENGTPLEDDLVFRYGCITGLEKMRWDRQENR